MTEAATTRQPTPPAEGVSSFAKSLFLGEIHEELVFPYPRPDEAEQRKVRELIGWLRDYAAEVRRTNRRRRPFQPATCPRELGSGEA